MATYDNPELFHDSEMERRYVTVYEFLANEGSQCGIYKNYAIDVLRHIGEALHTNTQNESLWKAYVLLDVLIDRWDECLSILKDEEAAHDCDY